MIQFRTFTIPAADINKPVKIDTGPFRMMRFLIIPPAMSIEVATVEEGKRSDFIPWLQDDVMKLAVPATAFFIKATTAGVVVFQWSLTDDIQTVSDDSAASGGVATLIPNSWEAFGFTIASGGTQIIDPAALISQGVPRNVNVSILTTAVVDTVRIGKGISSPGTDGALIQPGGSISLDMQGGGVFAPGSDDVNVVNDGLNAVNIYVLIGLYA